MAAWQRIVELFRRSRLDRELDDEMNFHLAMMESEFRAKGMSEEDARAAARREFGGVAQAKESYRDERGIARLENPARDARYALRGLRRNPGFAAAAVISLALGIGANTAVFSLFHAVMLRALPVSHPEQLVMLYRTGGWGFYGVTSYPLYKDLRGHSELFRGLVATTGARNVRFSASHTDRMQFVQQEFVSGEYFRVLGVQATLGRVFADEDNQTPHAHPVTVLSYDFWHSRMGGDPQVLGRTLMVDEQPLTVIGVAAPAFRGVQVETHADLWTPIMMSRDNVMQVGMNWLYLLARPVPDMSRARLQSAVDASMRQYLEAHYGNNPNAAFRRMSMEQRLGAARRRGRVDAAGDVRQAADHPDGRGGLGVAGGVCERGQPAASARGIAAAGSCDAVLVGSHTGAADRTGGDGMPVARDGRLRARHRTGILGHGRNPAISAGDPCAAAGGGARWRGPGVHAGDFGDFGAALRTRPCVAIDGDPPGNGAALRRGRGLGGGAAAIPARAGDRAGSILGCTGGARRFIRTQSGAVARRRPWVSRSERGGVHAEFSGIVEAGGPLGRPAAHGVAGGIAAWGAVGKLRVSGPVPDGHEFVDRARSRVAARVAGTRHGRGTHSGAALSRDDRQRAATRPRYRPQRYGEFAAGRGGQSGVRS